MKAAGVLLLLVSLVAACGTGSPATPRASAPVAVTPAGSPPAGSPGALPAADVLCKLLAPTDWTSAGLQGAGQPVSDTDGPGTAYCTYTTQAGANGGLEFDAFVDGTVADAQGTFQTITDEGGGGQPATLPGADAVVINSNADGAYGWIAVRNGRFSYTISLPESTQSQAELMALAAIVLARGQAYR